MFRRHSQTVKKDFSKDESKPVSVGSGLVALDWLLIGNDRVRPNEAYAGGSCGNVMAILAHLGWESYPIARLGRDHRAGTLLADLKKCKVQTDFVLRQEHGITPVIIVRLKEDRQGSIIRRYEWKHPSSGEWLPRYRPVPKSLAEILSHKLPDAKVFYFDRVEPSSLLLATFMRKKGAVVFFEPSSTKDNELFSACLAVSDIVKYSADRMLTPPCNPVSRSPRLEIQTLGEQGLRFRLKMNSTTPGKWQTLTPFAVRDMRDTTGCGDWCSAGIISKLCNDGQTEFLKLSEDDIVKGLTYGQALAAINCRYIGARGPMYHLEKSDLLSEAKLLCQQYSPDDDTLSVPVFS